MKFQNLISWQAKILHYLDRTIEAIDLIKHKKEYQETLDKIKKSKELKELATLSYQSKNFQKAIETFNACLQLDPLNFDFNSGIYFNIGLCHIQLNSDPLDSFASCLALNPTHQKCLFKRAEYYSEKLGCYQEAINDYQKVNSFDVKPKIKEA